MVFDRNKPEVDKKKSELDKIKSEVSPDDDFVELNTSHFDEKMGVTVKIDNLDSYVDTERIQSMLRNGNVIFLRIRGLREKDINELKKAVEKLRKTCSAMNGDIVGIDEDYLIITPSFARVFRGK
jgi:uncharacterized protein